jgi:uncharacterized protein YbjT (DUF2867 family)
VFNLLVLGATGFLGMSVCEKLDQRAGGAEGRVRVAARHVARARAAGLDAVIVDRPGLAHDVDTPADADRVRALLPPGPVRDLLDHRVPA